MLATINTTDFLYTCPAHLTDRGFATPVGEAGDGVQGTRKLGLTPEEIAKVKEEWNEVQRKKAEKDKAKEKSEGKGEEKKAGKDTEGQPADAPQDKDKASDSAAAAPSHERYALHRDYFAS